jgi:hypothetical protein
MTGSKRRSAHRSVVWPDADPAAFRNVCRAWLCVSMVGLPAIVVDARTLEKGTQMAYLRQIHSLIMTHGPGFEIQLELETFFC